MYRMIIRLDVGANAEDFRLKNAAGKEVSLSEYRGKSNLVLVFFAGGYDKYAMRNLREISERYPEIKGLNAEVLAITPELPGKVRTLTDNLRSPFEILSDPQMDVVRKYDVYDPNTRWTWPAAFIIDTNGVIQYAFRGASPPNTPHVDYLLLKLRQMKQQ